MCRAEGGSPERAVRTKGDEEVGEIGTGSL